MMSSLGELHGASRHAFDTATYHHHSTAAVPRCTSHGRLGYSPLLDCFLKLRAADYPGALTGVWLNRDTAAPLADPATIAAAVAAIGAEAPVDEKAEATTHAMSETITLARQLSVKGERLTLEDVSDWTGAYKPRQRSREDNAPHVQVRCRSHDDKVGHY